MPQITLSESGVTDLAIAANASRTYLEFSATASLRWCFGVEYVEAESQPLPSGDARIFQGAVAQQGISFSASKECRVDVTILP